MWVVYNKEDSCLCGWVVASEEIAQQQCEDNKDLTYCYTCMY